MGARRAAVITSKVSRFVPHMTRTSANQVFRFGEFELDVDAAELRRGGRSVRLQPQPHKLLTFIVRRAGSLVSRDEIRSELWPDGTYVDFDQAVNFAIKQIRDALGDSAERPLYVQTVPRRGYRFIAPVEGPADEASGGQARGPGTTTIRLQKALWTNIAELRLAQRRQRRVLTTTAVVAAAIIAALLAYLFSVR